VDMRFLSVRGSGRTNRSFDFTKGGNVHRAGPEKKKNKAITAKEVLLINEEGKNLGVVSLSNALSNAKSVGADLVQMSLSVPPVCRIVKEEEGKKSKKVDSNEVHKLEKQMKSLKIFRLRPQIERHDLENKMNQASKQLKKGHPVKFMIQGGHSANEKSKRELINSIYEGLVATGNGHTLDTLTTLYTRPFILLSPVELSATTESNAAKQSNE